MKKNVIITGVAGFIGSRIAHRLKNSNFNIIGIDDLSSGSLKNVPKFIKFIKTDLSKKNSISLLPAKCYKILHLAGQSSGEISFDDPISDLNKNVTSTLNLINYGIKSKAKLFLYASSMSVYGLTSRRIAKETDVCSPLSFYGVGKYAAEKYLEIRKKELPSISFRMFNVYGPGQNMSNLRQGMVSIYLAQALKDKKILIKGSLSRIRDFIYIDDVVDVWCKATTSTIKSESVINLGSGVPTTVNKVIKLISSKIKGTNYKVTSGTKGDQSLVYANNSLLKKNFKKKKFINLDEGLDKFINSFDL